MSWIIFAFVKNLFNIDDFPVVIVLIFKAFPIWAKRSWIWGLLLTLTNSCNLSVLRNKYKF